PQRFAQISLFYFVTESLSRGCFKDTDIVRIAHLTLDFRAGKLIEQRLGLVEVEGDQTYGITACQHLIEALCNGELRNVEKDLFVHLALCRHDLLSAFQAQRLVFKQTVDLECNEVFSQGVVQARIALPSTARHPVHHRYEQRMVVEIGMISCQRARQQIEVAALIDSRQERLIAFESQDRGPVRPPPQELCRFRHGDRRRTLFKNVLEEGIVVVGAVEFLQGGVIGRQGQLRIGGQITQGRHVGLRTRHQQQRPSFLNIIAQRQVQGGIRAIDAIDNDKVRLIEHAVVDVRSRKTSEVEHLFVAKDLLYRCRSRGGLDFHDGDLVGKIQREVELIVEADREVVKGNDTAVEAREPRREIKMGLRLTTGGYVYRRSPRLDVVDGKLEIELTHLLRAVVAHDHGQHILLAPGRKRVLKKSGVDKDIGRRSKRNGEEMPPGRRTEEASGR